MEIKAKFSACYLPLLAEFARPYLNGFYIESAGDIGGLFLVATDGHRAIVIHDPKGESTGAYIFPVPAMLVSKCKSTTTKMNGVEYEQLIELDGRMATLTHGALDELNVASICKPIHLQYPDLGTLAPDFSSFQPVGNINLDPIFLASLKKIARLAGKDRISVQIRTSGENKAVYLFPRLQDHSLYAVIMPVRREMMESCPEWISAFCANTAARKPPAVPTADGNQEEVGCS